MKNFLIKINGVISEKMLWLSVILMLVFTWFFTTQTIFYLLQSKYSEVTEKIYKTQFKEIVDYSDFKKLSSIISNFEINGLVECPIIKSIRAGEHITILDLSYRGGCTRNSWLLKGERINFNTTSGNGDVYNISLSTVSAGVLLLGLWAVRALGIVVILGLGYFRYFKIVNDRKISEAKQKGYLSLVELSQQVSHDIRSPLAALKMVTDNLVNIPEDKRILIRSSVNRINDISNDLLSKGKEINIGAIKASTNQSTDSSPLSINLLSPLIDSIVSEKRIQFREKQGVEIESDLCHGYGLFAEINAIELKRTLSNLINNSVEAFPKNIGKVNISIRKASETEIIITIADNGKGIPNHILKRLGEAGISHGKAGTQSGSGLGVYHAKKTVEDSGGQFNIQSREGHGTNISIVFKKSKTPKWFIEKLVLSPGMLITSLDDDISIHQIWKDRFDSIKTSDFKIKHNTFTAGRDFKTWFASQNDTSVVNGEFGTGKLYLVDYELLNQSATGLDIIDELGISKQSVLVTSRYEEEKIRARCEKLGVKLIPKTMAGFVPIAIQEPRALLETISIDGDNLINPPEITKDSTPIIANKIRYDLCLLDDDQTLVQTIWAMVAKTKGHNIKMFSTPEEFLAAADLIDRNSPIFIDVSLGNGVSGIDFSEVVHKMGFLNINLATGYSADSIKAPAFIGRIIGKDYPEII